MARNLEIQLRVSEGEKALIRERAEERGMGMSDYLRHIALGGSSLARAPEAGKGAAKPAAAIEEAPATPKIEVSPQGLAYRASISTSEARRLIQMDKLERRGDELWAEGKFLCRWPT